MHPLGSEEGDAERGVSMHLQRALKDVPNLTPLPRPPFLMEVPVRHCDFLRIPPACLPATPPTHRNEKQAVDIPMFAPASSTPPTCTPSFTASISRLKGCSLEVGSNRLRSTVRSELSGRMYKGMRQLRFMQGNSLSTETSTQGGRDVSSWKEAGVKGRRKRQAGGRLKAQTGCAAP